MWIPLMTVAAGLAGCTEGPGAALAGAVAACRRAPVCPLEIDCDDPGWSTLDDDQLDAIAMCLAGPCETRAECLDHVLDEDAAR
jgi:hypothetical protein